MAEQRREHLLRLRDELLDELEAAERELSRLRVRVERMESDLRIRLPENPDYANVKGHLLPRAEARMVDLFSDLLKLEDKLNSTMQD